LIQDLSSPSSEEDDVIDLVIDEELSVSGVQKKKSAALFEEVKGDSFTSTSTLAVDKDEGPTMMEQIMAAQAEAARGVKIAKEVEDKKSAKGFGGGFKKGFLGGGDGKPKSGTTGTSTAEAIPTIRANKAAANNGKAASLSKVNDEIRKGLAEGKTPLTKELERGEWMTPELLKEFSTNPVISKGLLDPRCKDALELMQKTPKEAQAKYLNDKVVDTFLKEFGKVMGGHFEQLGAKQEAEAAKVAKKAEKDKVGLSAIKTSTKNAVVAKPPVLSYGSLHEQALLRQAAAKQTTGAAKDVEDAKVKEIINNSELSAMLMDPKMQTILQECGDPIKFQQHMRDPATAVKIKKLFDAGLVRI
jgi:hypothetical protein